MDEDDDELLLLAAEECLNDYQTSQTSQTHSQPQTQPESIQKQVEDSEPSASKLPRVETDVPANITKPKIISKPHCVLVNPKQKGNPLLKGITSVPWEFEDIIPDYVMGPTTCALFLSLKYHNMNPDYIQDRLKVLGKAYELRVLLVQVDVSEPHLILKKLTRMCLLADLTLMLSWNYEEAGKIIETYKIYENKPPDQIMEKIENDPHQKIVNALSSIKPVNKTDAMTLLSTFGTLGNIISASENKLAQCPGFGVRKATKLYKVLHRPFLNKRTNTRDSPKLSVDDEFDIAEIEAIMQNNDVATSSNSADATI
ncbi:DNA excision repair protein Ercc1 [Arctopsyche grandis]|uniref:DNA excision repair protein Ercc1 n=1 Tax=Arctopsyche grandis TaxID=121162 RepID=UPI00406D68DA